MIDKPFDQIGKSDIDELINRKVEESKTLEYKQKLNKDSRELTKDVSSFANAVGGDIIYGVCEERTANNEKTGRPEKAIGIEDKSNDELKQWIENVVKDNITPRPKIEIKFIEGYPSGPVLVIRIRQSFSGPHMIKGQACFYSRNSSISYPLDVEEIRSAFVTSESLPERIRSFRAERLSRIIAQEVPVNLKEGARFVIHLVPLSAFLYRLDKEDLLFSEEITFTIIEHFNFGSTYHNFDGYICANVNNQGLCGEYLQIFRNGAIEHVDCRVLGSNSESIPSQAYERDTIFTFMRLWELLRKLPIEAPILIMVSLLGVKGLKMGIDKFSGHDQHGIDRDSLVIPDIRIEDYSKEPAVILRPIFDIIWQSCGFRRSFNYKGDKFSRW